MLITILAAMIMMIVLMRARMPMILIDCAVHIGLEWSVQNSKI